MSAVQSISFYQDGGDFYILDRTGGLVEVVHAPVRPEHDHDLDGAVQSREWFLWTYCRPRGISADCERP